MATTLTQMQTRILTMLQKTSSYEGFFTTTKLNQAINESQDYICTLMQLEGKGWFQTEQLISAVAGTGDYTVAADTAMIHDVKYKIGMIYESIIYNDKSQSAIYPANFSTTPYPVSYRMKGNAISFNPAPQISLADAIMIEYSAFPTALSTGSDNFNQTFQNAYLWYIQYRAASALVAQVGKGIPDWANQEREWKDACLGMIQRVRSTKYMQDFRTDDLAY